MPQNNENPDNNTNEELHKKKTLYDVRMKRLIRVCFKDLIISFFPEIAAQLDFTDFNDENFLAEEHFPEFKIPGLMRSDTVVKVKLKNSATP
jgi:hypothetical protein